MAFSPNAYNGIMHHFAPRQIAFEIAADPSSNKPENVLIWIGGLGDGLLTVPMPAKIADRLPRNWAVAQAILRSSYGGWGISSLKSDADELSECVQYFRSVKKGMVVLMGHSTGCQDVMEYLTGEGCQKRPHIDGGIIQAPVSDREGLVFLLPKEVYEHSITIAEDMVSAGRGEEIVSSSVLGGIYDTPVSARRWLSLAAHGGDDDYFSSDLSREQLESTFGRLPAQTPLCILYSGSDEFVPEFVDKEALVKKWIGFVHDGGGVVDESHSGVVPEASHNLRADADSVVQDLTARVIGFLQTLDNKSNT